MTDVEIVSFLQWALPRMGMRWAGFRKVRGQVGKRVGRRLKVLGLVDLADYRAYLEAHDEEWAALDPLCRVTISRFFRDIMMWTHLVGTVLPRLAEEALKQGRRSLLAWSVGCASGEEPYTLALLWRFELAERFPDFCLQIIATDADPHLLDRARAGLYRPSSLKQIPEGWREEAFEEEGEEFRLREDFRKSVAFEEGDIRRNAPAGLFDLVFCRNLAFTYFDEEGQRAAAERIRGALRPGGSLLLGAHEVLLIDAAGFVREEGRWPVFRKDA